MKEIKTIWFDHRTDLPKWITSRIGQIIVEWSVLERELEELIQMLVNTDIGFTRIMVNRLNARNRISAAHSLIEWYVFHKRISSSFLKEFSKIGNRIANEIQNKRDMVAHGLWSFIKGNWWVLKQRGQRPTPELRPELEKLSRAFIPQRELITREKLDKIVQEVISGARAVQEFRERLHRVIPDEPFKYEPAKIYSSSALIAAIKRGQGFSRPAITPATSRYSPQSAAPLGCPAASFAWISRAAWT
jgi:hypothetical protein